MHLPGEFKEHIREQKLTLPNSRLRFDSPLTARNSRCTVQRGQHSLGSCFCFDLGHCSVGQVFLAQLSLLPLLHWQTKQRSSIEATTSWPSATVWPLILQPAKCTTTKAITTQFSSDNGLKSVYFFCFFFSFFFCVFVIGREPRKFPHV